MPTRKIRLCFVPFDQLERETVIAALRTYSVRQKTVSPAEFSRAEALVSKIFATPILTAEIEE